jgi:hypothetical protein
MAARWSGSFSLRRLSPHENRWNRDIALGCSSDIIWWHKRIGISELKWFHVLESPHRPDLSHPGHVNFICFIYLMASSVKQNEDLQMIGWQWIRNWNGRENKLPWLKFRHYASICKHGLRKPANNISQDNRRPVEIRTKNRPNTNQKHYCLNQLTRFVQWLFCKYALSTPFSFPIFLASL